MKGSTVTTYVVRYRQNGVTITRHFKESHEMHKHFKRIWDEVDDIQVEKLTTTRVPMPKLLERLYKGV